MQIQALSVFIILLTSAALAGCSDAEPSPTPAATPTQDAVRTSTPTPEPYALVIAPDPPASSAGRSALQAVESFAAQQGWAVRRAAVGGDALRENQLGHPMLVAAVGSGSAAALAAAAQAHSDFRFLAVEEPGVQPRPNLLVVGGENYRADQAAFMAGLLAGIENRNELVGWIGEAGTVRGKIHQNGFRHGIRYICPRCRVFDYELTAGAAAPDGIATAAVLMEKYADTASAIPGSAGDAALAELAKNGVRVAGSGPDVYRTMFGDGAADGAKFVLGEPVFRPDFLLAELLPRFVNGETFPEPVSYSLQNGGLEYAPFPNDWISPGRAEFLQQILDELTSGRLDIGIDPQTGEEL